MVELPSELVRQIAEKLSEADGYALDWPLPQGACNCLLCCKRVTRALLTALFEACEVREECRIVLDDERVTGLWMPWLARESVMSLAAQYDGARVERRLVIETKPEPVVSDDSEKGAGDGR